MLVFLAIVVFLLVIVLAFMVVPLFRPSTALRAESSVEKRDIFRQQFDEIEQDKMNGMLDAAQYDIAKIELERRMLDEIVVAEGDIFRSNPDRRLAIILLVLLPPVAFLLYFTLGNPASIMIPATSPIGSQDNSTVNISADHKNSAGDIEQLLNALKSKLEKTPDDGAGWALLARSYVELRQHPDAVNAYEKAVKATPNDPQLLADYADALAVVNGHNLEGKPEELVKQALKLDSHHTKSLMLAASAAFNRKDYKQAIVFWERLQQDLPAGSEILPEVKAALNEVYALSGKKAPIQEAPISASQKKAIPTANISGTVNISPDLASKLDPTTTVFVFARATQGSPMPLAIVRAVAKDLPYRYILDDSTALMPGNKLSQAGEVVVVARISKSGDAKPQAGDFQGVSASVKPNGRIVDVEINQVVP